MVSQPIRLILVDWFVFHFIFWGRLPFFICFKVLVCRLSSWVKIRMHTENQLARLPQSGLKVPGWWWWVPKHYQVKLQLMLRLSWAVTIIVPSSLTLPWSFNALFSLNSLSSKETFGQNPDPSIDFNFYMMM